MWYRDYALMQQRVLDLRREADEAALVSGLLAGRSRSAGRRQSRVRATSAAAIRRLGSAAIELSERLDCTPPADGYSRGREPALR